VGKLIYDEEIEDIMINNTTNIFVTSTKLGEVKLEQRIKTREELNRFVGKIKLYSTNMEFGGRVSTSRCQQVQGQRGLLPARLRCDIRNFKKKHSAYWTWSTTAF